MSIYNSRTAQPVTDTSNGAAMGTWGLWLTMVVLVTFVAGLSAAALYLHTGQPQWPPQGITRPSSLPGFASVGLAVLAAVSSTRALAGMKADSRRVSALALAASAGLLTASVLVLVYDLATVGFGFDEHAFTSIYWIHTGMAIFFNGVGLLIVTAALVQMVVGLIDERRHLELTNASIYVWFAAATNLVLMALVHLLPGAGAS